MVAQQIANGSQTTAFEEMESLLPEYSNVKGVICENASMALGAQAALKAAGRDDVIVVSLSSSRGFVLGGSDELIQSIMNGEIDAGILPPVDEMAAQAVIQADRFIRAGSTGMPEKQAIDMILLTPENACGYTDFAPNGKTGCP